MVVVDECHCICIWSDEFRKMYGLLGTIRIFLLPGTPFCAATATLTSSMRKQVLSSLRFSDDHLAVNRGWWKPNLSWHVYNIRGSDSGIQEITHMLPKSPTAQTVLPMTIVFVDKRGLAFKILAALLEFLPSELAEQVEVYHALQSEIAKELAAWRFQRGKVRILICTEALTMVSRRTYKWYCTHIVLGLRFSQYRTGYTLQST
jgi:ATP-dependent DNA helicase RecQ